MIAYGTSVTTDSGRFAGRSGTVLELGGMPGEVWVQWLEPSAIGGTPFKTLDICDVSTLRVIG